MKNYIFILAMTLSINLMAQEELGWMEMEIFMMTTGLSQGETVRYKMEALGTVWRAEYTSPPSGYEFSNNHNLAYYPIFSQAPTGNTNFNNLSTIWGYNWMQPFITYNQSYDSIAHGLYKVSASLSDQYFYLDYRDDRYNGSNIYRLAPGGLDIWILYNKNLNRFMYRKQGIQNPDPQYWIQVQKGDYVGLWTIKEVSTPTTGNFPDFWSNCLSVSNDGSNHPKLIWGPHPSFTTTHFYIYRAVGTIPIDPKNITYSLCAFIDASTFEFTSYDFVIEVDPTHYAFYYVKAFNSSNSTFSSATNGVSTEGQYVPYKIAIDKPNENQPLGFDLDQNYPNPFNPSTTINYTLPENSFITLKVFNVLGIDIETLVNEYKQAGTHSVEFNAGGLPSGLYLYKIESGNFREVRKMILLK